MWILGTEENTHEFSNTYFAPNALTLGLFRVLSKSFGKERLIREESMDENSEEEAFGILQAYPKLGSDNN